MKTGCIPQKLNACTWPISLFTSKLSIGVLRFSLPVPQTGDCPAHLPLSISYLLFEGARITPSSSTTDMLSCYTTSPVSLPICTSDLVKKILTLEYINISQLLLEHHDKHDEAKSPCCSLSTKSTQWPPSTVSNIVVWLDCYAFLVTVLCSAHPDRFSQIMMYQKIIILAH